MSQSSILDSRGRPVPQAPLTSPSRESGSYRGTLSHYRTRRVGTPLGEAAERVITQERAADLYANNFAAKSSVDSIATNAVGTGLMPRPVIPYKQLGISRDEAKEVKEQMLWNWEEWCPQADAAARMAFEDLQLLGIKSLLRPGELVHLPVMLPVDGIERTYGLALQALSPLRMCTPSDLSASPDIRDGVHLNAHGAPLGYYIAAPVAALGRTVDKSALTSADFRYIKAKNGHRPGIFHIFKNDDEEQVRGTSSLGPGMKLFKNLDDAIDYELLAQVLAASFPVFIGMDAERGALPPDVRERLGYGPGGEPKRSLHQTVDPGTFVYGEPGEKPEVLESRRPSQNFMAFCELVLRAQGAMQQMPYEVVMKDFSKSNYSSIRAAMNEAWKVFMLYRRFYARHYCQPIWAMVQEEAYLRGRLKLPKGAPGFYERRLMWCNSYWDGPSRGFVDPVKEVLANIYAINNRLASRTKVLAEQGEDFDETMDVIEDEDERMKDMPPIDTRASARVGQGANNAA